MPVFFIRLFLIILLWSFFTFFFIYIFELPSIIIYVFFQETLRLKKWWAKEKDQAAKRSIEKCSNDFEKDSRLPKRRRKSIIFIEQRLSTQVLRAGGFGNSKEAIRAWPGSEEVDALEKWIAGLFYVVLKKIPMGRPELWLEDIADAWRSGVG